MRHRMVRGELHPGDDPELVAEHARAQRLLDRYNATTYDQQAERDALLRQILGDVGRDAVVRTGLRCEYGRHVALGPGAFLDHDCHLLDATPIRIGAGARLGPRVQLLAATFPVDPYARRDGWRKGKPVTIGDNVFLGAGVIVCPGVTIGHDTVVGAGAVVTRDLPPRVVATGNPARPRRHIDALDVVTLPSWTG